MKGCIQEFDPGGAQHQLGSEYPLNSIDFTGPVGGLVPIPLPPEYASEQCPCKIIFHFLTF